jgi:hypothetical protein
MLKQGCALFLATAGLALGAVGCHGSLKPPPGTTGAAGPTKFSGLVRTEWLSDGRNMVALEPFTYRDAANVDWTAPRGTVTDGASIPQAFWSLIGGPYEGAYRDAALLHDYQCCVKQRPWRAVHRMFYEAMLARGEAQWRAKLMYFAVYHFGPRWPEQLALMEFTEGDAAAAAEYLKSKPETPLEEIEQLTPARLRTLVPNLAPERLSAFGLVPGRVIPRMVNAAPCLQEPSH